MPVGDLPMLTDSKTPPPAATRELGPSANGTWGLRAPVSGCYCWSQGPQGPGDVWETPPRSPPRIMGGRADEAVPRGLSGGDMLGKEAWSV